MDLGNTYTQLFLVQRSVYSQRGAITEKGGSHYMYREERCLEQYPSYEYIYLVFESQKQ